MFPGRPRKPALNFTTEVQRSIKEEKTQDKDSKAKKEKEEDNDKKKEYENKET